MDCLGPDASYVKTPVVENLPPVEDAPYGTGAMAADCMPLTYVPDSYDPHQTDYQGGPTEDELAENEPVSYAPQTTTRFIGVTSVDAVAPKGSTEIQFIEPKTDESDIPAGPVSPEGYQYKGSHLVLAANQQLGWSRVDASEISKLDRSQVNTLVQGLPPVPEMPAASEIAGLAAAYGNEPLVVEKRVTVGDIATHIRGSNELTPEIKVDTYQDADTLCLGDTASVPNALAWNSIVKHAGVQLHTHPGPLHVAEEYLPSDKDLSRADAQPGSHHIVASEKGLTLYATGDGPWVDRFNAYIGGNNTDSDKLYYEFVKNVIRPITVGWNELPSDLALAEVAEYMRTRTL